VYNPRYVEPFTDKSKLPSSIDDFGERVFLPVKALVPSHKITHYHDPLVELVIVILIVNHIYIKKYVVFINV